MSKSRKDLSHGFCNNWNLQIRNMLQLSGDCVSKYEDYNYGDDDDVDDDDDDNDDEEEEEEDDHDNADDDDDDQWC